MSDNDNLVHISARYEELPTLAKNLDEAKEEGRFEGYEFLLTDNGVDAVNVDAIAEGVAERLEGVELADDRGDNEKPDGYTMIGDSDTDE